jgi:hypothetical protein
MFRRLFGVFFQCWIYGGHLDWDSLFSSDYVSFKYSDEPGRFVAYTNAVEPGRFLT